MKSQSPSDRHMIKDFKPFCVFTHYLYIFNPSDHLLMDSFDLWVLVFFFFELLCIMDINLLDEYLGKIFLLFCCLCHSSPPQHCAWFGVPLSSFFLWFCCLCSVGDWTLALIHAPQMHHHWATPSVLFSFFFWYGLNWPQTCDPSASASQVLGRCVPQQTASTYFYSA